MLKLCYIADVPQLEVLYIHNLCTTLVVGQKFHTIPTGIHHQQQQRQPSTTQQCNYSAGVVSYL